MIRDLDRVVFTQAAKSIEGHTVVPGDVGVAVDILGGGAGYNVELFTIGGAGHGVATVEASQVRPISPHDVEHARPDPKVTDGSIDACSANGANDIGPFHFHRAFGRVVVTEPIRCSPVGSIQSGDVGTIESLSGDHEQYCIDIQSLDGHHIAVGWAKPNQIRPVTPHDVLHARVMKESPAKVG